MARRQASKVPEGTEQIETIRLPSEKPLVLNFPYLRAIRPCPIFPFRFKPTPK